jgi:hypothetical protein
MLWQVYLKKAAAFVSHFSICIIVAVSSGLILTYAWRASPRLAFVLAVLLFGAGLFQFTRWKTSFGRAISIGLFFGVFFGLLVSSVEALYEIAHGPEDFTDAQAKKYFDQHQRTFTALVNLISQCEGSGRISIYPDSHVLSTLGNAVTCSSTNEISTLLKAASILWINVGSVKPYGEQGPFSAMFVLSSRGIVGHGSGSAIYYFPESEENPFGDSLPLEATPGHWFYRRS